MTIAFLCFNIHKANIAKVVTISRMVEAFQVLATVISSCISSDIHVTSHKQALYHTYQAMCAGTRPAAGYAQAPCHRARRLHRPLHISHSQLSLDPVTCWYCGAQKESPLFSSLQLPLPLPPSLPTYLHPSKREGERERWGEEREKQRDRETERQRERESATEKKREGGREGEAGTVRGAVQRAQQLPRAARLRRRRPGPLHCPDRRRRRRRRRRAPPGGPAHHHMMPPLASVAGTGSHGPSPSAGQ